MIGVGYVSRSTELVPLKVDVVSVLSDDQVDEGSPASSSRVYIKVRPSSSQSAAAGSATGATDRAIVAVETSNGLCQLSDASCVVAPRYGLATDRATDRARGCTMDCATPKALPIAALWVPVLHQRGGGYFVGAPLRHGGVLWGGVLHPWATVRRQRSQTLRVVPMCHTGSS